MKQLTKEEAIKLVESGIWKTWSKEKIAYFQLHQDRLCMPFSVFHEAVEYVLKRPVYTHEFGLNRDGLIAEMDGKVPSPTIKEIIDMLVKKVGKDKVIIVKPKKEE